ncbi:glycosyltransferase 87 family protein [Actinomadura rifamycini]|uniref:glycosyltransferase 87 family protein n=1 Tax=Actinomadura rifamycini TaxID=31962 RepID=UPI000402E919|nr:glycosyltransferase 87 family protein [Actinomadura rifamycini]
MWVKGSRAAGGRPADLLIVLAGIAVAAAAIAPIAAHWLTNPPDQRLVDLEVYREGGRAVLRGAPLYEVLTQPPQFLPFTYPPFAAALAVPFTLLPWGAAQIVWTALVYAALVVVVRYAFRDLLRRTGRWAPLATGALVGAAAWILPDRDQIRFGQVGLFLLAMCLADCCTRSPRWPRGVLVGLAVAIKLVPGVFLIYFLVTGRFRAAGNAVMTAVGATLLGFMLLPSDSVDYWFGALLQGGDRTGAIDGTTNQAINGIVARVLPEGTARSAVWLVLWLAMAYIGFRLALRATHAADALAGPPSRTFPGTDHLPAADRPASYGLLLAGVSITGLLSVLLSPVGWIHHFVWMIPVIGALVGDGRDTRRCLFGAATWFYFLWPLPWWGARMIGPEHGYIAEFFGRVIQDLFGLAAIASVFVLGRWLVDRTLRDGSPPDPSQKRAEVGTLTP